MSQPRFGRMIPAMVTPFDENRELDLDKAQALAARLVDGGSDSLIINGTTKSRPCSTRRDGAVPRCGGGCGRPRPHIANVGDNCTADTVGFARDVAELSTALCVWCPTNKPPQEGMYRHFRTIADAVELPIILYNIPGRCVVNMEAETTLRLAHDCDNVVAVKEASGKMDQVEAIVAGAPDGFVVYSGDDSATLDVMKRGGAGVISTIGNVSPARMKEIVELAAAGDWEAAEAANERLMPLMTGLFETSNPILVKEALKLLGFPVGGVRLPLVDATPEQSERLAATMREVGAL
ncbi:MAG: 4-hydroxy-tetrahydrodipicolinate synthase [Eggerthella lenta]